MSTEAALIKFICTSFGGVEAAVDEVEEDDNDD